MDTRRFRIIYSGRVQGVGFRYTCLGVAHRFQVAGFVKNLSNGNVELIAEGEEGTLERFLAALEEKMTGYISDRRISREEPTNEFSDFGVRY